MTSDNAPLSFASRFINNTGKNIFLTGKAGTGKTTFLKNIRYKTHKKTIVAAPTGIAAINAGGVTLHSLFQLPFGCFIPSEKPLTAISSSVKVSTPKSLLSELKLNTSKRNLIRELELLIIDEVSMLRADTLDAIDLVLRYVRRKNEAFGGVQLLLIGDLLQLPPVVVRNEEPLIDAHYSSAYFFASKALQKSPPIYLELDKIFRQSDPEFIQLLNHFRDNELTDQDFDLINNHYKPGFTSDTADGYVNLTTHNHLADSINQKALANLPGEAYHYDAFIDGKFEESAFPLDYQLTLKKGAQVMFIKNDYSGKKQYYNGKLGKINELDEDYIEVVCDDLSEPIIVERYTWENKRFSLNKKHNTIEEKTLGTFTHYPLKLAWSITIHKSQGLTFDKAILDLSRAFAPGQIYVALSRLSSPEGLVLTEKITRNKLKTDIAVSQFAERKAANHDLPKILDEAAHVYLKTFLEEAFDMELIHQVFKWHYQGYNKDESRSAKQNFKNWALEQTHKASEISKTGKKFLPQLKKYATTTDKDTIQYLKQRVKAARKFFYLELEKLKDGILKHQDDLEGVPGVKKYLRELDELKVVISGKQEKVMKASALIHAFMKNEELEPQAYIQNKNPRESFRKKTSKKPARKDHKSTIDITYELIAAGKTISEIAVERELKETTIEQHMVKLSGEGKIDYRDFVDEQKIENIKKTILTKGSERLKPVKEALGEDYSYGEIRLVLSGIKSGK